MRFLRKIVAKSAPTPTAQPPHDWPTADELRAMLDPNWDPEKQWDGSPAQTQGSRLVTPSRPKR